MLEQNHVQLRPAGTGDHVLLPPGSIEKRIRPGFEASEDCLEAVRPQPPRDEHGLPRPLREKARLRIPRHVLACLQEHRAQDIPAPRSDHLYESYD